MNQSHFGQCLLFIVLLSIPQHMLAGEQLKRDGAIPRRDPQASPSLIDLSEHYTASLDDDWLVSAGANLQPLPKGLQTLAGVRFDVRGLIQLAGTNLYKESELEEKEKEEYYPKAVEHIAVQMKGQKIHFLHASSWAANEEEKIGEYIVHYENGETKHLPLLYSHSLRDWWTAPGEAGPKNADIAWKDQNEATKRSGHNILLFKYTWKNPLPGVKINTIDFVSSMTTASPFLVAITIEEPLPEAAIASQRNVVRVGAGGYLRTRPRPCKPLPEIVHKTENFTKPVITGQWWSSLLWQKRKFSQPLFAHPLAATCTETGLAVHYPGSRIHGNASGIFGVGAGKGGDLKLGHSSVATFQTADCDGYSDWFVSALFARGAASMRVSLGHGSPFVYCLYRGGDPAVSFARPPQIWSGSEKDPVLGITAGGHHYGLFGATGSTWTGIGGTTLTNNSRGKPYFSVAVLPDNRPETLAAFHKVAYNHVVDTRVDYRVEAGHVQALYRPTVKSYEGSAPGTIFALYPHQWKYTTTKLTDLTYGSVRGTMKVAVGETFATKVPIQGVLPMFPPRGVQDRARMLAYLKAERDKIRRDGFGDTYWEGKLLGRLATLSGIAEATGDTTLQRAFIDEIKRRLEHWFTATPGKDQPVFYYNGVWNTLIGSKPSYGSDSSLNDHHFHYGYFIRAAAEVARVDRAWAEQWGPMVELLIRDVASPDRNDPMFAYLQCFDKYAGHSWASGDANFADGNNQESSSESMNAWYGMILWGEVTGKTAIRDTGLYLFNTERTAVEEYWFDVSGTNYPDDFPNVALGMVWGGKGAFGTWFSGDIDCIHGINWLPFTPASYYMGRWPQYVKKNHDRIVEKRKGGRNYNNGWGDLVIMFYALSDPAAAAEYIDANPNCKVESGNSHAFMYHWIHTLNQFGINDAGVTADYPIHGVFQKGGVKTYAVYNYQAVSRTVKFSDGTEVMAGPKTLTVQRGR